MRTIKFRGQSEEDFNKGEWIFGYLADENYISDISQGHLPCLEVKAETVGQFTGMKTKATPLKPEREEVYEDDILRVPQTSFHIVYNGQVVFEQGKYLVKSLFSGSKWNLNTAINDGAEIIGNVHSNPELLRKGVTDED